MRISAQNWSVPVRLEEVPEAGLQLDLVADAGVRTALAKTAGVEGIPRLAATFEVRRHGRDGLCVAGTVSAMVRQTCVVTLEPIENELAEAVDLTFMPDHGGAPARGAPGEDETGAFDQPEALVNGTIDLGAIAAEFLILGVDPYPRKAGAVFAAQNTGDVGDHPFAALAALKKPS